VDPQNPRPPYPRELTDRPRRFIVCGDNPLAYRLVDELATTYDAQVTAIVTSRGSDWAPEICRVPGVAVVEAARLDADAYARAGLAGADALALVGQDDDAGTVNAALLAQEIRPDLRIVMRMSRVRLGERMSRLLNNCEVLSAATIAAPAFVAAALDERTTAPMAVADRHLVATPRAHARLENIVVGLASTASTAGPGEPVELPEPESAADLVLATSHRPPAARRRRRRRRPVRVLSLMLGTRVRAILIAMVALFVLATVVLALVNRTGWGEAAYVALLTELGGANADPDATGPERLILIALTFVSIAVIPLLTAALVDSVVKARLRIEAGGLVEPVSDHVIVIGLGHVGTRVVQALTDEGVMVVAVEVNPAARGVPIARELGVPVIIGDASHAEVLAAASVATCRALVIVSTDDVVNLETALLARAVNPDLRVVMRLFDGEFADRVQKAFAITTSRSVSYLAAPAFAAAMLSRQVIATIPVKRHVLLVAEVPLSTGSPLVGRAVGDVQRPGACRLIAVRGASGPVAWLPAADRPLAADDVLVVVTTRAGLGWLLGHTAPTPTPARTRPDGPLDAPPFGPADAAAGRTA
jgi:Trk K+ transport system NAD-binding subunit